MLNVQRGRAKGRSVNLKVENPGRYLERESRANELCANLILCNKWVVVAKFRTFFRYGDISKFSVLR